MSDSDDFELKLYAVRSKDKKWYKSRGQGGAGPRWVDGVDLAKIYTKPGPAKAVVTWWSKNYPEYGIPELVEITAREVRVIDQKDRLKEKKLKEEENRARKKLASQKIDLENAMKALKESQAELDRLKKKQEDAKQY